jgi:hypothetical protein
MATAPDIRGTVLTEGIGAAKGTRFRTDGPNQRLNTGGREQGISGGKGGVGAVARDINVGDPLRAARREPIKHTMYATDGDGVSARAIEDVGSLLVRATNNYADRVTESEAIDGATQYSDKLRKLYYGEEEDGLGGLAALKGKAALDARADYFTKVDEHLAEIESNMSPAARQKALAKLQSIRETALNRGASHIAKAQDEWDNEVRYQKAQDATRSLVLDYADPAMVEQYKGQFAEAFGADGAKAQEQWDKTTVIGANRVYLNELNRSGSGVAALKLYRDNVKDTLTIDAQNDLDEYVMAQEKSEETVREARERKAEKDGEGSRQVMAKAALTAAYSDPERYVDFNNIVQDFPGIHPVDAKAAYTMSKDVLDGKTATKKDETALYQNVINPMRQKGQVFANEGAFYEEARKYGIDPVRSDELYKKSTEPLAADEKTLNDNVQQMFKSIDLHFGNASGIEAGILRSVGVDVPKADPASQRLKDNLYAISQQTNIPPIEREEQIRKAVEAEVAAAKAAPADQVSKMSTFQLFERIGEAYRVKGYLNQLQPPEPTSVPSQQQAPVDEGEDLNLDALPEPPPAAVKELLRLQIISKGGDARGGEEVAAYMAESELKKMIPGSQLTSFRFEPKIGAYVFESDTPDPKTGAKIFKFRPKKGTAK